MSLSTPVNAPRLAVGAIVVDDGSMLMVKRGRAPARGLWSVPGGRVEAGEYLNEALRREVREETGLEVQVGPLAGIHEVLGDPHYVILDYLATVTGANAPSPGDDVDEVRWVALEDIPTLECTPRFVETMRAWGILEA